MNTETFNAEGAYKLAEILALKAEQEAQITRKVSEWEEQYGSMAAMYSLRAKADEQDAWARVQEERAERAYDAWAAMVR